MKRNLSSLLRKLEESQVYNDEQNIQSLNDALSKNLRKGGYDTNNLVCQGSNSSCQNGECRGTTNSVCHNISCME